METGETFAVKKILIDKEHKSREVELLEAFAHPNVLSLKDKFLE